MDINVGIFLPDVLQQIDVPLERQFRMVAALHQDLNPARRRKFVQLLIDLLERKNVMVFVPFRPIKRAEFAVNVADIRVIDIAIDDIGHDLTPAAAITFRLCQIPSGVRKRAQFLKWPAIQLEHVVCRNPFARENAFREHISVNRNHRRPTLDAADGIRTCQTE